MIVRTLDGSASLDEEFAILNVFGPSSTSKTMWMNINHCFSFHGLLFSLACATLSAFSSIIKSRSYRIWRQVISVLCPVTACEVTFVASTSLHCVLTSPWCYNGILFARESCKPETWFRCTLNALVDVNLWIMAGDHSFLGFFPRSSPPSRE